MRVLILCTGNSARSIVGEFLLRQAFQTAGVDADVISAGSKPAGAVNPAALALLSGHGFDVSAARSQSWDDYAAADQPPIDLVITVCAVAAGETCPIWPGAPITVHWGLPDPAHITPDSARDAAFRAVYAALQPATHALADAVAAGKSGDALKRAAMLAAPTLNSFSPQGPHNAQTSDR